MNIAADRLTRQRLIGFAVLVTSVLGSVGLTASLTDARAMMESLGNAVAASAYAFKGDVRVAMTVSIGVVIAGGRTQRRHAAEARRRGDVCGKGQRPQPDAAGESLD